MTVLHYDSGTPLIPAQHQPAVLLEHLRSLDVDPAPLLEATGLQALLAGGPSLHLAPAQLLALLHVAAQAVADQDLPFQLGRQMLPGHFGAASHALMAADSLRRALQVLQRHGARLSPLLVAHVVTDGPLAVLYWTPACPGATLRAFLVDLQMSAVTATCQWLAGERLPWSFLFNRTAPRHRDAHEVHLGTSLRFNCHLDAMVIDARWLDHPWTHPRALHSRTIADALDREATAEEPRRHLLATLYDHLLEQVRQPPSLENAATRFGVSPATFKRRLAACGTHYQAELDQVRLHLALHLMHGQGLDTDAIARHLGIEDPANFRRSMKRWVGLTPAQLRLATATPADTAWGRG